MKTEMEKTSRALFSVGLLALILGLISGFVWGSRDAARIFFCASVVLAAAWTFGYLSRKNT